MMNIITAADARQIVYEKQHQAPMSGEREKVLIDRILDDIYAAASRGEVHLTVTLDDLDDKEEFAILLFLKLLGFGVSEVEWERGRSALEVYEISWRREKK